MRFYKFLVEREFQKAQNSNWPSNSNYVVMFNPHDSYGNNGRYHGSSSHMIKHFFVEFRPETKGDIVNRFNVLVANAPNLWIGPRAKEIKERTFSFDTVLNSLDLMSDKVEMKKTLSPTESKIWDDIVVPYTKEYEKMVDELIATSTVIKPGFTEDEIKKAAKGNITFPVKYHDINGNMFVNIPKGIVCTTTRDNKYAKTLFKTSPEGVRKQIAKQTIAYENIKKALV